MTDSTKGSSFLGNKNGNNGHGNTKVTSGTAGSKNVGDETFRAAERYKGLGNKQMANQQYEEAYDSYSRAIDLTTAKKNSSSSPSATTTTTTDESQSQLYVYYSNRAAACLSLKRYNDAVEDATKSIELQPNFGKAHARLGQAYYFCKRYEESVVAYRTSLRLEESQGLGVSEVTVSYLDKAERKLKKRNKKQHDAISPDAKSKSDQTQEEQQQQLSPSSPEPADVPQQQQQQQMHDQEQQLKTQPLHHHDHSPRQQTTSSTPSSPPVNSEQLNYFHRKAETHYSRGEYSLALKDYNAAFKLMEDEAIHNINQEQKYQMLVHRGMCFCRIASAGLRSTPQDEDDYYNDATRDAREAIQDDPTHFAGYRVLGRSLYHLQNLEEALWAFTEALTLMSAQQDSLNSNNSGAKPKSTASTRFRVDHITPQEYAEDEQLWAKCKQALRQSQEINEHIQATTSHQHFDGQFRQQKQQQNGPQEGATSTRTDASSAMDQRSGEGANNGTSGGSIPVGRTKSGTIPKLPPPRFVPREQAISTTPNVTRMPKHWPKQYNSQLEDNFWVGPERNLVIHKGGGMGMKLHRGTDGFVRVLSTTPVVGDPSSPTTKLAPREGYVEVGDVVREVAGVDLRRPITNPMWADTVHLIKMTPRPITFVVAPEISTPPLSVQEELRKSLSQSDLERFIKRPPPQSSSPS